MPVIGALSCLQGRPAGEAAREVLAAGADGVQLTPGCAPDPDLEAVLAGTVVRTHHGWTPRALRRSVWDGGELLTAADSVHPPRRVTDFRTALDSGVLHEVCVEVMYPGWALGDDDAIADAMAAGLTLAVDVSHLHIGLTQGAVSPASWRKLAAYDRIGEVHVSANDGRRDAHAAVAGGTWGLPWAAERLADGAVVVIESYWHHLSHAARASQVAMVRTALS